MCDAVEGLFLEGPDVDALRASAEQARRDGLDAVWLIDGQLGDAMVLASALAAEPSRADTAEPSRADAAEPPQDVLWGVRVSLSGGAHRHPTILAREMTTFDHITRGRSILAFVGPFPQAYADAVAEAITLCRGMWSEGIAVGRGPCYPVAGAVNRPLPFRAGGPPLALDLTDGSLAPPHLLAACDLVLVPTGAVAPATLPPGVDVCQIQGA
jgi:alkanesulfonate monooxygenase SsuD/methylene tetrahydromethanopterin reductase-like flavin-dependent oxidoreductase (luciferase family)